MSKPNPPLTEAERLALSREAHLMAERALVEIMKAHDMSGNKGSALLALLCSELLTALVIMELPDDRFDQYTTTIVSMAREQVTAFAAFIGKRGAT